jgi:L-ribulose-5-phosphate 3-epimerase
MNRRHFLQSGSAVVVAGFSGVQAEVKEAAVQRRFSVRWEMVEEPGLSVRDKFQLVKDAGYDGLELDSQFAHPVDTVNAAREATGLIVHGVVNANHWSLRLSDPTADLRRKAVEELQAGIRYAQAVGAGTLEVLPGAVRNPLDETHALVEERSAAAFREVLPLAESCQVKLAVCNGPNGFYDPNAPDAKPGEAVAGFVRYLDAFQSPWIGFSLQTPSPAKTHAVPDCIRAMGGRLLGIGVQDLGAGPEEWREVGLTLRQVGYAGWNRSVGRGGDRKWLAQQLAWMKQIFSAE